MNICKLIVQQKYFSSHRIGSRPLPESGDSERESFSAGPTSSSRNLKLLQVQRIADDATLQRSRRLDYFSGFRTLKIKSWSSN